MTKRFSLLLALLMLLACCSALADGPNIPDAIRSHVTDPAWQSRYDVLDCVQPLGLDTVFLAAASEDGNHLLCFRQTGGVWQLQWNRKAPMPQHKGAYRLTDLSGVTHNGMTLGVAFSIRQEPGTGWESVYELEGSVWKLRMLCWHDTDDTILETYRVESGVVKYDGWRKDGQRRIYGTLQNDLRYFSYRDFPFDPDKLKDVMSSPPAIPDGTLSARRIQFTGGKKYPVYNGPGSAYGLSGNGSAHVSTNDWIQVFGEENGWIMIQYDITRDRMRIGWIDAGALPRNANVPQLDFAPVPARVLRTVSVTDDPLNSGHAIFTLLEGQNVHWLATLGDWAYIECADGRSLRGFVPLNALVWSGEGSGFDK